MPSVKGNKKGGYWIAYLKQRLSGRKKKNFVGFIQGETGSGKSYSAISIGEMGDPNFTIDQCVFTISDLIELMESNKLRRGSFIILEEVGIEGDAHKWYSKTNMALKYILETFRHRGFVLIMTAPYVINLAKSARTLLHGIFQPMSIDYDKEVCYLKPFLLQYNPWYDKTYKKFLRVMAKKKYQPVKRWAIPMASKEIITQYEIKKREFTDELNRKIKESLKEVVKKKYEAKCIKCDYEWKSGNKMIARCPKCNSAKTKRVENGKDKDTNMGK